MLRTPIVVNIVLIRYFKDGKLASNPASLFESDNFDVGYGDVLTFTK